MRFFRQEHWSGLPFPTPGDLPHPGIEPTSPVSLALQANSLPAEPLGKPKKVMGSGPLQGNQMKPYSCFKQHGYYRKDTYFQNSAQFSCSVMSDSLWPQGLQHARLPCPSPIPGAWTNSCPLSQCCHPTISSSVIPFSSHLQSFPASESFWMSQFLA